MRLSVSPLGELPPVTKVLVFMSFAGWLAELAFGARLNVSLGLVPYLFIRQFWLWQGVTYIFIHADFWHFFFNAFMLWMLGRLLEPEMGSRKFLAYFLVCGAAAALVTAAWTPSSLRPVIGASGGVFGLLGAFAFLHPADIVYVYFFFPMSARAMALLLGAVELVMTFAKTGSRISSITHLGGLAAGLAWLWVERKRRERTFEPAPDPALAERAEIDRLLEKISKKGQGALGRGELARLDEYARKNGGRA